MLHKGSGEEAHIVKITFILMCFFEEKALFLGKHLILLHIPHEFFCACLTSDYNVYTLLVLANMADNRSHGKMFAIKVMDQI